MTIWNMECTLGPRDIRTISVYDEIPIAVPHSESLIAQVPSKVHDIRRANGERAYPPFLKAFGNKRILMAQ